VTAVSPLTSKKSVRIYEAPIYYVNQWRIHGRGEGGDRKKKEKRKNRMKIQWSALLHRATIKKKYRNYRAKL